MNNTRRPAPDECRLTIQLKDGRGGVAINGLTLQRVTGFAIDCQAGQVPVATISFYPTEVELDLDIVKLNLIKEEIDK